jgi:hypothetical protein
MATKKYRVYKELYDDNGNIVNKMPVCSTTTLKMALSMARTNAGIGPVGIYEINPDGTEKKII